MIEVERGWDFSSLALANLVGRNATTLDWLRRELKSGSRF
jgi:hypothetical protein